MRNTLFSSSWLANKALGLNRHLLNTGQYFLNIFCTFNNLKYRLLCSEGVCKCTCVSCLTSWCVGAHRDFFFFMFGLDTVVSVSVKVQPVCDRFDPATRRPWRVVFALWLTLCLHVACQGRQLLCGNAAQKANESSRTGFRLSALCSGELSFKRRTF